MSRWSTDTLWFWGENSKKLNESNGVIAVWIWLAALATATAWQQEQAAMAEPLAWHGIIFNCFTALISFTVLHNCTWCWADLGQLAMLCRLLCKQCFAAQLDQTKLDDKVTITICFFIIWNFEIRDDTFNFCLCFMTEKLRTSVSESRIWTLELHLVASSSSSSTAAWNGTGTVKTLWHCECSSVPCFRSYHSSDIW